MTTHSWNHQSVGQSFKEFLLQHQTHQTRKTHQQLSSKTLQTHAWNLQRAPKSKDNLHRSAPDIPNEKSIVPSLPASLVHISHRFGRGMAAETSNTNHTCRWTNLHKFINAHVSCTGTPLILRSRGQFTLRFKWMIWSILLRWISGILLQYVLFQIFVMCS